MRVECTYLPTYTLPDLSLIKQLPRKTREGKKSAERACMCPSRLPEICLLAHLIHTYGAITYLIQ